MRHRTSQFAVSATIISAVILGFTFFGNGIDGAGVAIAQMKQAMREVHWIHAVNDNSVCSDETWLSFEQKIEISKKETGKITYRDYTQKIKSVYSPETKTITLSELSDDTLPLGTSSIFELIEKLVTREQDQGATLIRTNGTYQGIPAEILEMNRTENNWTERIQIFIDATSHLPLASEVRSGDINSEPNYLGNIVFDYPPSGPQDIYALGIPNSTRVDDLRPSPDVLALLKTYRDYRNNAPVRYALASIFDFEQSAHAIHPAKELFGYVSIMYEDQGDRYHRLDSIIQTKAQYANPMGNTFAAINNWCHQTNATVPDSIYLWDGMYHYETSYNTDKNKWEAQSRKKDRLNNQLSSLQQKGWPTIASNAQQSSAIQYKIIKDDYSEAHNLICIEKLKQGYPKEGTHQGMPPTRHLYYLNPDKDYICQRHEEYRRINGPWQQDRSWLNGVDPNHIRRDATIIIQASEYAQTKEMKWYPKVVIRTGNGSASDGTATTIIETSLFEDRVDFPDGIFDPKKLTASVAK